VPYLPRIESCFSGLMGSLNIGIFGETKSQQYSEHLYFSIKNIPTGYKTRPNQVFFVYIMHIKVSLHHLIKWSNYCIIDYLILVFLIIDRWAPKLAKFKAWFWIFLFSDFPYVGRYIYIFRLVIVSKILEHIII